MQSTPTVTRYFTVIIKIFHARKVHFIRRLYGVSFSQATLHANIIMFPPGKIHVEENEINHIIFGVPCSALLFSFAFDIFVFGFYPQRRIGFNRMRSSGRIQITAFVWF